MNYLKFLAVGLFFVFTSCASRKGSNALLPADDEIALVGKINKSNIAFDSNEKTEERLSANFENPVTSAAVETTVNEATAIVNYEVAASQTTKKAKSFTQMKAMVKNGELTMSKKDFKMLNKLERLSQKKLAPLRDDPFELTDLAKIIFGVGAAGLLIYAFGGGLFFLFLFLVGLGAFLCRWIGIIDF